MNKYIKYFLIGISGFVFCFFAISFIELSMNVTEWSKETRELMIFLGAIISLFSILINGLKEMDKIGL